MARRNREGRGRDQHGHEFVVAYQPDWLHQVKVTRALDSGRLSTKTLFRNDAAAERPPGARVHTRLAAAALGLELAIELGDARGVVRRITIETVVPDGPEQGEVVTLVIARKRGR